MGGAIGGIAGRALDGRSVFGQIINEGDFGHMLASATAGGIANAATRSAINGESFGKNLEAAIPDIIGQAVGGAIGRKLYDPNVAAQKAAARQNAAHENAGPVVTAADFKLAADLAATQGETNGVKITTGNLVADMVATNNSRSDSYAAFLKDFDATFADRTLAQRNTALAQAELTQKGAAIAQSDPQAYKAALAAARNGNLAPFDPSNPEMDIAKGLFTPREQMGSAALNKEITTFLAKNPDAKRADVDAIIDRHADKDVYEANWGLAADVSLEDLRTGPVNIRHTWEEPTPLFNQWVGYMADSEIGSAVFMGLAVGDSKAVDVLRQKYPTSTAVGEYGSMLIGVAGMAKGVFKKGAGEIVEGASISGFSPRGVNPAPGTRIIPEGIPNSWRIKPTDGKGGVHYYNPKNPNENIRIMQGNPNSSYPNSQLPYARQQNSAGTYLRQDGTPSPLPRGGLKDPDAHIPLDQFKVR